MTQEPRVDLRVTRYVMDEMGDEQRQEFEAEMASSPELQRRVNDLQETVSLLRSGFAMEESMVSEPVIEIANGHVMEHRAADRKLVRERRSQLYIRFCWVAAASLVMVVGIVVLRWRDSVRIASTDQLAAQGVVAGASALRRDVGTRQEQPGQVQVDDLIDSIEATVPPESQFEPASEGNMDGLPGNLSLAISQREEVIPAHSQLDESLSSLTDGASNKSEQANPVGEMVPSPSTWSELSKRRREYKSANLNDRNTLSLETTLDDTGPSVTIGLELSGVRLEGVGPNLSGDQFDTIVENDFLHVTDAPLSTFSIDTDTASYSKIRSFICDYQQLPRPGMVRIEELINYFPYKYAGPENDRPFAAYLAATRCPWNADHRLVRVALKGREIDPATRPASNLVFLLDVSGSMDEPNKFPLLVRSLKLLTRQLTENDRVAIVVYAGAAGLVLDSTTGDHPHLIEESLDRLRAGGSTNGGAGIELAYQQALDHFISGGTNRVILCTDGDFNVGTTSTDALVELVAARAKAGVFLTVLGFGTGNLNDSLLEQISNRGNGNYAFVDSVNEAQKVLVEQMAATIVVLAKDVKVQVEFNPNQVASYRLLGYENRVLAAEDFNDDTKDAGEIGPGHTVTALYEIVPVTAVGKTTSGTPTAVDPLKYQTTTEPTASAKTNELLTVKVRYKQPTVDQSELLSFTLEDATSSFQEADRDLQFAAAVAAFGMVLRDSRFKGNATLSGVAEMAQAAIDADEPGAEYRREFVDLVRKAKNLAER